MRRELRGREKMSEGQRGRWLAIALAILMTGAISPHALCAQGAAQNAGAQAQSETNTEPSHNATETSGARKRHSRRHSTVIARTPPSPGMVWANTTSKVYHKPGSRWYGRTREGKWMTEADARKAGYKAGKN
jgi:hypothetical protein